MRRKIHLKKAKKLKFGIGNTIIIILVLILTMTFFSINYLNKNVVPVLMGYASSQVRKFSNLIINRAISKQIPPPTQATPLPRSRPSIPSRPPAPWRSMWTPGPPTG